MEESPFSFPGLLDDPRATPAEASGLEMVVQRHARRRVRRARLVGASAVLVLAATAAGISVSAGGPGTVTSSSALVSPAASAGQRPNQTPPGLRWSAVATGSASTSGPAGSHNTTASGAIAPGFDPESGIGTLRRLFVRSQNGVTIRAFLQQYPSERPLALQPVPAASAGSAGTGAGTAQGAGGSGTATTSGGVASHRMEPVYSCGSGSALVLEVSDHGFAGSVFVPLVGSPRSPALTLLDVQVLGTREDAPLELAIARTGAGVRSVSAAFAGGATDAMGVVGGVAVLASTLSPGAGTAGVPVVLGALDGAGHVLEKVTVGTAGAIAEPFGGCAVGGAPSSSGGSTGGTVTSPPASVVPGTGASSSTGSGG